MTGSAGDTTYGDALTRRYLAIHPEHADWLLALPFEDRAGLLTLWLDTFEGRRHALADDAERAATQLDAGQPHLAAAMREMARDLRENPIVGRPPGDR